MIKKLQCGRPFIIASHSQGTYHARRLLQEVIQIFHLRNRMVAVRYRFPGIDTAMYKVLKPCQEENQTGCYITWASLKKAIYLIGSSLRKYLH